MRRWTLAEIRTKIENDLDLEAEDFVTESELLNIINEGVDECEAHIHKLNREDQYFLAKTTISLVVNESDYELPTDIYANKILSLTYVNGSTIFPIKRLRGLDMYQDMEVINRFWSGENYRYAITNQDPTDGYRITIFPPSRETRSDALVLWYIRNANRLVDDTDVCDIPEFVYYVIAFAKYQILYKEGHPNLPDAKMELERQRQLMLETLNEMVPDDDNEIVKDFSAYNESS